MKIALFTIITLTTFWISCKKDEVENPPVPENSPTTSDVIQEHFDESAFIGAGNDFRPTYYFKTDSAEIVFALSNDTIEFGNTAFLSIHLIHTDENINIYLKNGEMKWIESNDTLGFFDKDGSSLIFRTFDISGSNMNMIDEGSFIETRTSRISNINYKKNREINDFLDDWWNDTQEELNKLTIVDDIQESIKSLREKYNESRRELKKIVVDNASNAVQSSVDLWNNTISPAIQDFIIVQGVKCVKFKVINENASISNSMAYPNGSITISNLTGDVQATLLNLKDTIYQDLNITTGTKLFGNMTLTAYNFPIPHSAITSTAYNFSTGIMEIHYKFQNMNPPLVDWDTITNY